MEEGTNNDDERLQRVQDLIEEVEELESKVDVWTKSAVLESASAILNASNEILREVKPQMRIPNSGDLVADAKLLANVSRLQSEVMQKSNELNEQTYIEVMRKRLLRDGVYNWDELIKDVCQTSRSLSVMPSLYGAQPDKPLEVKVRKARQTRNRTVLAQETAPEHVNQLERKDKGNEKADIALKQITEICKRNNGRPVQFYKLVLNPNSFGKSIQNIFMLSFLAREHSILIDEDENGLAWVSLNKAKCDESKNKQAIVSLDLAKWKDLLQKFQVTEAMLNLDA